MTFKDSFEATVDRSTNLSDVEKFNYLLSYLQKGSLRTTYGMLITSSNQKKSLEPGVNPEILKAGGALCLPPWLVEKENFRFQMF